MLKWQTKHTHIKVVGEEEEKDKTLFIAIPILILAILLVATLIPVGLELVNIDFDDVTSEFMTYDDSATGMMARPQRDEATILSY